MHSTAKPSVNKIGFISPPKWFDISPTEFLRIAPGTCLAMQTIMRPSDFTYTIDEFLNSVPEMQICFDSLSAAGTHVVAQFGYPFALVHGWKKAQEVQKIIQGDGSASFIMMGLEIVNALKYLNCGCIGIASTYYSESMEKILHAFLIEAGLEILSSENWQTQGMADTKESGVFIGNSNVDSMDWQTPEYEVETAIRKVALHTPNAEGILVTGGGIRVLNIAERLEQEIGKPIIGGDIALYWGILRRLGVKIGTKGYGRLLAGVTL